MMYDPVNSHLLDTPLQTAVVNLMGNNLFMMGRYYDMKVWAYSKLKRAMEDHYGLLFEDNLIYYICVAVIIVISFIYGHLHVIFCVIIALLFNFNYGYIYITLIITLCHTGSGLRKMVIKPNH